MILKQPWSSIFVLAGSKPLPKMSHNSSRHSLRLLRGRRIVLKKLGSYFCQILAPLFRAGFGVERLGSRTSPDQLFRGCIVHIYVDLADANCFRGGGAEASSTSVSISPSRAVSPSAVVHIHLLLRSEAPLNSNHEVTPITSPLLHAP